MIVIPSGRNPFEVAILLACVMFGLTGLFAYDEVATNSLRAFPELWGKVFLGSLVVGAGVALVGIARSNLVGLFQERSGLVVLIGACSSYALWALGANGPRGIGFALLMFSIAGASAARIREIHKGRDLAKKYSGDA